MAAIGTSDDRLDIGRVIVTTFRVIGRNFVVFSAMTLLLVGVPVILVGIGTAQMMGLAAQGGPFTTQGLGLTMFGGIIALITNAVLQGALVHGTVRDLDGRPASFAECLATGLRHFLPVIGLSILMGLAVGLGMILLIVPGVMLATAWAVAVPAKVAEGIGVFDSFGRSAELTRGNRWRIFGLMLIYLVINWLIQAALAPFSFGAMMAGGQAMAAAQALTNGVASIVSSVIAATGVSVIYAELRRLKDGLEPNALAALFD